MTEPQQPQFPLPNELQEIFLEYQSALECRRDAINSRFRAKRAIYYGKQAAKLKQRFWSGVVKVYPELEGKPAIYDPAQGVRLLGQQGQPQQAQQQAQKPPRQSRKKTGNGRRK